VRGNGVPAFELRVLPQGEKDYRLALWQRAVQASGNANGKPRQLAALAGLPLQVALDQVLDALKREGYRVSVLNRGQSEPLALGEESGVRLGLLFLALRPLTKL
jgi:hypothetical protein